MRRSGTSWESRGAWLLTSVVLLASCADPLKDVELVSEPRVLGARVEVSGEPERASPAPGETAVVRWLVAAPEPDPALVFSLAVCGAAPDGSDLPACAEAPFAEQGALDPVVGEPRLDFTVPTDTRALSLAVLGEIAGTLVAFDFALAPAVVNQNPIIEPEALSFDGQIWAAGSDCALVPAALPGSQHALELLLDESDREPLVPVYSVDPLREPLQASNFATGGELERAFTNIPADQSDLSVRVDWQAPRVAPESGVVRFFFVVRDSRGGTAWQERAVCVAP